MLPFTGILFLLIFNVRIGMATNYGPGECENGGEEEGRCFEFHITPMTWRQARSYCNSRHGILAKVTSPEDKASLVPRVKSWDLSLWTGGSFNDSDWTWLGSKKTHIRFLGCYHDRKGAHDLSILMMKKPHMRPSECALECQKAKFKYSSVQLTQDNEVMCRCGDGFGQYGRADVTTCDNPCPYLTTDPAPADTWEERQLVNLDTYCGAENIQMVVRAWGLSYHAIVSPSVWGQQDCAALDHNYFYLWKSYHCTDNYLPYICQYGVQKTLCTPPNLWRGDFCISIENEVMNWWGAYLDCKSKGGDIIEIKSDYEQRVLREELSKNETISQSYWIGLTKKKWRWDNAKLIERYFDWAEGHPNHPDIRDPMCILLNAKNNYSWTSEVCDLKYPYVCEYNSEDGVSGLSGTNVGLIAGVAAGAFLLLLLIVVIVIGCIRLKKKKPVVKRRPSRKHPVKTLRNFRTFSNEHQNPAQKWVNEVAAIAPSVSLGSGSRGENDNSSLNKTQGSNGVLNFGPKINEKPSAAEVFRSDNLSTGTPGRIQDRREPMDSPPVYFPGPPLPERDVPLARTDVIPQEDNHLSEFTINGKSLSESTNMDETNKFTNRGEDKYTNPGEDKYTNPVEDKYTNGDMFKKNEPGGQNSEDSKEGKFISVLYNYADMNGSMYQQISPYANTIQHYDKTESNS